MPAFGTALPLGLTYRQQNAWLYEGGRLETMQVLYAERFDIIQFAATNTGTQMGGRFNKEVNITVDLQSSRCATPGKVMEKLGVLVQVLPAGEISQSLQTGPVDTTEWVGPYDDTKLGFDEVASFCWHPGWWEPWPTLEVEVGLSEWKSLPEEYQAIVQAATCTANLTMMARDDVLNP